MRPLPIEPDGMFDGLRWSAILLGALLDNVLTVLAMIPITLFVAGADALSKNEEVANEAIDRAILAPEFLLWSFVVGLAITVYAAFWAARRAGLSHLRHGGWTAVTSAVLASLLLVVPGTATGPEPPLWYNALALTLMVPAGVFGGWVASRLDGSRDPRGWD